MMKNKTMQRLLDSLEMDSIFPTSSIPLQCDIFGEAIPLSRLVIGIKEQVHNGSFRNQDVQWIYFLREELQNIVKRFIIDVKSTKISMVDATLHRSYVLGIKTAIGEIDNSIDYYFKKTKDDRKKVLILPSNPMEGWNEWLLTQRK